MSYEKPYKAMTTEKRYVPKETLKEVAALPFMAVPSRGISKETCEKFGVRVAVSEENGKDIIAAYFPSYNQKGKLTGYKKQDFTKEKGEDGHWSAIGVVSISNKLFGQDVAEKVQRKRVTLTCNEGEWDTMSVYQAIVNNVKNTKYEGLEPFVVSIPLGTANAVEAILHNNEFVHSFSDMSLFFDDDYCTPKEKAKGILKGHEAREAVASALVGSSLSLSVITPGGGYKDASDMIQDGKETDLAKLVQFGKRAYSAEKIAKASSVTFEELIEKCKEGVPLPSFPKLQDKIRGLRKRELVMLTAGSGVGKSTITSIFAADMLNAGCKVGMIFLEETKKQTLQRMVAHKLKVNYNTFKNDPTSIAAIEDIRKAYDDIVTDDKVVLLDHFGNLPVTELMSKVKHMVFIEKCEYIIVDHLALVASGSGTDVDERKVLDHVCTELAAFCASNDVGVIAISHLNRTAFADNKAPKDADEKPYWIKVDKSHMRGSAALEQLSWVVLGVENQIMPDRSRGNVRITVLKNRTFGYLGVCDEFSLNPDTWEVELAEDF